MPLNKKVAFYFWSKLPRSSVEPGSTPDDVVEAINRFKTRICLELLCFDGDIKRTIDSNGIPHYLPANT